MASINNLIRRFLNWWLCEGNPDKKNRFDWLFAAQHYPIWIRFNASGNVSWRVPLGCEPVEISPDDPINRESL